MEITHSIAECVGKSPLCHTLKSSTHGHKLGDTRMASLRVGFTDPGALHVGVFAGHDAHSLDPTSILLHDYFLKILIVPPV